MFSFIKISKESNREEKEEEEIKKKTKNNLKSDKLFVITFFFCSCHNYFYMIRITVIFLRHYELLKEKKKNFI